MWWGAGSPQKSAGRGKGEENVVELGGACTSALVPDAEHKPNQKKVHD